MDKFKLYNRIVGWVVFLIAAATYLLTAEPTVSLWDCGEFISAAFKLQVGHPPGAPFFMLVGRFFSLFAGGDVTKVAFMINSMSALASAFTIIFLYWSIVHLAKKIAGNEELKLWQTIAVIGSGIVGALAYTFSDTFWFSAVEGEVYASSSLFTAIVFWAILKWENVADEKYSNRWLIFIAYLMGLSIGVHLLNLLAIPAIVLVVYFKRYQTSPKGVILALIVGFLILAGVMYGLIPGVIWLASIFELMFVNGFGLPFNSGLYFYLVFLVGGLVYGLYLTDKNNMPKLNTAFLIVSVIIIGYSSYAVIMIRATANPPMNENSPETVFKLQSYLNREQYGDRPLVYGQNFNAEPIDYKEGKKYYNKGKDSKGKDKYVVTNRKFSYEYNPKFCSLLPRMWSQDNDHIDQYISWAKMKELDLYNPLRDNEGKMRLDENNKPRADRNSPKAPPTFFDNQTYLVRYQINFMYLRYFWWNFVGRQNDDQGYGSMTSGNWISGIPFIDKKIIGDGENMPAEIANTPSRNRYYALPFILGLLGLLYHFNKNKKDAWVVMTLFFLTGLAIVIYLNQYPNQPRERDYAYAGSFYAFAIWIGLGVMAIIDMAGKAFKNAPASIAVSGACLVLVPGIMVKENWDDHDRSGRYTTLDIARNYLNSCAPNAILFTNGDNDTFPLWYAQEVEGIRTDVRIVNLMLLNMDWYADAMKIKAYESDPLPISMTHEQYIDGTRDRVIIQDKFQKPFPAKDIMEFVKSSDPRYKLRTQNNMVLEYIPTLSFKLPVDTAFVLANGTVKPEDAHLIDTNIIGYFEGRQLGKSDLILFDIIANNNWKRPIYFVSPGQNGVMGHSATDKNSGLDNYLQLEGFAYRLVPIKTAPTYDKGRIDADILYKRLMEDYRWGRMNEDDCYLDNFHLRTLNVVRVRIRFTQLAEALIKKGDFVRAEKALDRIMEIAPNKKVPYDYFVTGIAQAYFKLNKFEKGDSILTEYLDILYRTQKYYLSMSSKYRRNVSSEVDMNYQIMLNISHSYFQAGKLEKGKKVLADCLDMLEKTQKAFFSLSNDEKTANLEEAQMNYQNLMQIIQLSQMYQQTDIYGRAESIIKTYDRGY